MDVTHALINFFAFLAGAQFLFGLFLFFMTQGTSDHAVFGMSIGLYLLWIVLGGFLTIRYRDAIRDVVQRIALGWRLKFVLFSAILALLEEAITTAMTNTAPFYGMTTAQAHITASSNYWDVVLTHSVVLFVPMFCIWAWILSRYDVSPGRVFLLWGLSGTLMEMLLGGSQHILEIGMWMFVYGLMIYLPAYCIPRERPVRQPRWWHYPLFVVVVFLGIIPGGIVATIIRYIRPPHFFPEFG